MAKKPDLPPVSVVIPTLNEADYIGYLLYSLSRQTFKNFEVILSDGCSTDGTTKIVKGFEKYLPKLKIVVCQRRSPSVQRNEGARLARYERLLFLDADTILQRDFMGKSLPEIVRKKLDIAHPFTFPITQKLIDQYLFLMMNLGLDLLQEFFPLAGGGTLFSTKTIHQKIGGFDEKITKVFDDVDYVERGVKARGHFGIIKSVSPFVSVRRFDYEGRGDAIKKLFLHSLYVGLLGKHRAQEYIDRAYGSYGMISKLLDKKRERGGFLPKLTEKQFNRLSRNLRKFWRELSS